MRYCANCEAEAMYSVCHSDGNKTPLCHTCRTAYLWGQSSPGASVEHIGAGEGKGAVKCGGTPSREEK